MTEPSFLDAFACVWRIADWCRKSVIRHTHAHAEVDAPTTLHSSRDIHGNRQVGDHNLSAGCAQSRGAFIFVMNQCPHRQAAFSQPLHNRASDAAYSAGGTCDKDGPLIFESNFRISFPKRARIYSSAHVTPPGLRRLTPINNCRLRSWLGQRAAGLPAANCVLRFP
jgi:hypothetical protein